MIERENGNAENLLFQIQQLEKQHFKCGVLKKRMFEAEKNAFDQADKRADEHILFERYERDLKSE